MTIDILAKSFVNIYTALRSTFDILKINGSRHIGMDGHLIGARDLLPYNSDAFLVNTADAT